MAARKSKKRTLRALSGALIKDLPTLEEWNQIIAELEGVSEEFRLGQSVLSHEFIACDSRNDRRCA